MIDSNARGVKEHTKRRTSLQTQSSLGAQPHGSEDRVALPCGCRYDRRTGSQRTSDCGAEQYSGSLCFAHSSGPRPSRALRVSETRLKMFEAIGLKIRAHCAERGIGVRESQDIRVIDSNTHSRRACIKRRTSVETQPHASLHPCHWGSDEPRDAYHRLCPLGSLRVLQPELHRHPRERKRKVNMAAHKIRTEWAMKRLRPSKKLRPHYER